MNDNGKGLRALFYGLCSFWDIDVWDEERTGPMPAEFFLPFRPPRPFGTYVVIVPTPASRQVEIEALLGQQAQFIVLDDWDLDEFRLCRNKVDAAQHLSTWVKGGGTHAAGERKRLGIGS